MDRKQKTIRSAGADDCPVRPLAQRDSWRGALVGAVGTWLAAVGAWAQPATVDFADGVTIDSANIRGLLAYDVADLDRDGADDVIVVQKYTNGNPIFSWYRLEESGWVGRDIGLATLADQPNFVGDMTTTDLDGDGYLDVIIPNRSSSSIPARAWWFKNPGSLDGSWTGYAIDLASGSAHQHAGDIEVGDLDGDGKTDIVVRDLGANNFNALGWVHIAFQNALPLDWTVRSLQVRRREGLKLGDLDRDGDLDIVLNGFWWESPDDPRTEPFVEHVIDDFHYTMGTGHSLNDSTKGFVIDLDGDGRDNDVVLATAEGELGWLTWYEAPDDPRVEPWVTHRIEALTGAHQARVHDINRDGFLDIVSGFSFGDRDVVIWYGDGGSDWTRDVISNNAIYSGRVGDVDGDGDLDILGSSHCCNTSGRLYFYESLLDPSPGLIFGDGFESGDLSAWSP